LIADLGGTAQLLNVTDLHYSFAPGPQLDLVYHGDFGWDLEVGYFSIDGWNASADRGNAGGWISFTAPGGFEQDVLNATDKLRFDYTSRFYTFDLNVRNRFNNWLTLLGGFRWVQLHEEFVGSVFTPPPVDVAVPFWSTNVDNHL
jgi:hypothetical protein